MTRRRWFITGGAAVLVALAVFLVWWFVFRDTSPASVLSAEQAEVREQALDEAQVEEPPTEAAGPLDLDGTWTVDTSIGTFEDFSSSFVGFRIDEELASIGAKTVVGRTPDVEGSLVVDGTTISSVDMVVDMTTLTTDSGNRDRALRGQAIETNDFPTATFALSEPIELGSLPADGETISADATGELTVHGVTQTVTIPLQAQLDGATVVVLGEFGPFPLELFDIDKPSAAVVVSVEDEAIMELQLFFTR